MRHIGNELRGPGFRYLGHFARPKNAMRGHNDVPAVATIGQKLDRIAELSRDRLAAERGERAAGSPSRSFSSIAADELATKGKLP